MVHRLFTQRFWHELFEAGVFLKAVNSLWETSVGLYLLSSVHPTLRGWFVFFTKEEFLGGRDEFIFQYISNHLNQLSLSTKNFVGLYLLFHGLLNMFLSYNLYRNRLWAYPVSIGITSLFLVYQSYRLFHTHSLILLCVTIFDIAFIYLTWHEYKYQLHKRHTS
ncbi:hypothetical protein A2419_03375 [Candidatus Adlerbacteria bacterium RIFOXYC1_FULL_48_26]|uniref:DUF2127 domain-containing protein n=1 Tax=Candidatus Adlerbacteria bacterium RIFOXYC1_FULL_48_26 TaxID=1797247 RepID=A0A1F4Y4A1_9BACT|nr:MAG: hypothetical protein A2419_03375 [Candidatus Adlerbacteria bacterium RIFOXYC1_FULL_48_26]OGC94352.1 MAG: hypothetical protein A2389_01165 [Candidatus Adlerbacteria bacterium RIFOXYB1_FULL_48_10]OGC95516.1 MAG: hypothetical protein A2590_00785 [Candidatus Adlerbacteria bacterium RIFOXYD1_FULL_48_8]